MAINFPSSPILDQIFTSGNTSFIWNGTAWVGYSTSFVVNYNASSIVIKDDNSIVGATTSINFGDNLTVSAISAGIVTVTGSASGSSSQFATTAAGIHTLSNVGLGTTNPTKKLTVSGDALINGLTVGLGGSAVTTNTAIGYQALGFNTTGYNNTANGSYTLYSNTIGDNNSAMGGSTLYSNITGNRNTAIGSNALYGNITGNYNTAIGFAAGQSVTGSRNTILGLYDGNQNGLDIRTSNNNVVLSDGDGNIRFYANSSGNVGLGTTNPTSALTVKGNTSLETLNVSGVSTFAGITTVTGTTLFAKQLNVSGISTFNAKVKVLNNLEVGEQAAALNIGLKVWNGNAVDSYLELFGGSNEAYIRNTGTTASGINISATGSVAIGGGGTGSWSILANPDGSVSLALSVIEKLRTIGAGVTVTGTTFTNNLSVSGIASVGTVQISSGIVTATSGIVTYYGDTSNASDGRWTLGASGTNDYTFTGIGFTQTTNDPVLYLARGRVYEFVNNSGGGHPFEIRTSNNGSAYSNGVTNNAAASGIIRFQIPFNAPNTLYYQCTNHSGMGNTISVYPNTI